mgnify:CR=1 FL=1
MIEEKQADEMYSELFTALDTDGFGQIEAENLYVVSSAMGWSESQVNDLISQLDPNHSDSFNFQEFILILKFIDEKQLAATASKRSI